MAKKTGGGLGDWGAFGDKLDAFPGGVEDDWSQYFGNETGISPNAQDWELYTGPKIDFTYEQQENRPVAGVNMELRNYSPFTFRVLPPLIYLDPKGSSLLRGNESGDTIDLGIISQSGLRGNVNPIKNANTWAFVGSPGTSGEGSGIQFTVGGRSPTDSQSSRTGNREVFQPAISDMDTAKDISLQLEKILNCPPLTLFINPQSFEKSFNKVAAYQDKSRYGYIYQAWGEEQPTISISGRIGAFIAGARRDTSEGFFSSWFKGVGSGSQVPTGVQFASKRDSASFQQLMALMTFYRNNGYIYDTLGKSEAHHLVGLIAIDYDQWTYLGNIDSFDWGYTAEGHGGGIEFSLSFTAVRIYDNKTVQSGASDSSRDTSGGFNVPPLNTPTPTGRDDLRWTTSTEQEAPLFGLGGQSGILTGKGSVSDDSANLTWAETNRVNAKAQAAREAHRKRLEEEFEQQAAAGTQGFINDSESRTILDDAHLEYYYPNTDYFGE